MVRNESLKKDKTTPGIIDSKSVKNIDTAEEKGYDAGKKVSGIKLHIVVDTLGLPHAVHVTCADVTDRKGTGSYNLIYLKTSKNASNSLLYRKSNTPY